MKDATDNSTVPDITRLLQLTAEGESAAKEDLILHVYDQLHRIAQNRLSRERSDHTLQPTELVHEAYLRMSDYIDGQDWSCRAQFYGAAAEAMRRVLINYARARNTSKRGSGKPPEILNVLELASEPNPEHILALNEAIQSLEEFDPQLGKLVHLRFFAGLSIEETAEVLQISRRSVIRHWNFARAWLARELQKEWGKEGQA